ncbi:hypothetical protein Xbed_03411 [Xenorhabdus beddingii]|uniref:Uncharacterized protein n=1 Tax=Xenorhabdus beddingii TaxID=40578 RepID=A0A1Y2SDK1_9GAMM|nr:hypothetical protein Xbed_03411 [Xenorhabdus beddingii]
MFLYCHPSALSVGSCTYFLYRNQTLFSVVILSNEQLPERDFYGEPISSSFFESTINEVIAKRMVKKQQMQWSQQGAHDLLQTLTAVLKTQFEHGYPDLKLGDETEPCWTEAVAA